MISIALSLPSTHVFLADKHFGDEVDLIGDHGTRMRLHGFVRDHIREAVTDAMRFLQEFYDFTMLLKAGCSNDGLPFVDGFASVFLQVGDHVANLYFGGLSHFVLSIVG